MEKQSASNIKISHAILSVIFSILFIFTALYASDPIEAYADDDEATWKSISPTVRTDAGVLERRQAQRRWSGREQDGVASEHNGALPQRGRFGSSITPNLCVLCYPFHPHCLQAFPTTYSFTSPCVRVERHEHFFVSPFFPLFPDILIQKVNL